MPIKPLIDFHCHLDLYPDFPEKINICELNKIYTLAVTTTPKAWRKNKELTINTKYVKPALGLHPQLINSDFKSDLVVWKSHLNEARYIGEVGIDASPLYKKTLKEQIHIFENILSSCSEVGGKILSVHSVRASTIVLDCIEKFLPKEKGLSVLHWFTGNTKEAKRAIGLGCYFSVNTSMLQTNKGVELIKHLPIQRLLTETDGPFTENTYRANEPSDVINSVVILGRLLNKSKEEIAELIYTNFKQVLST